MATKSKPKVTPSGLPEPKIAPDSAEWNFRERAVSVALPGILSTLVDGKRKQIYFLSKELPDLFGYAFDGREAFRVAPPPGYRFNYLTPHPEFGPAVVCVGDQIENGWQDYHFSIAKTGELTKKGPAY